MIAAGALPPHRVALLAPGERDEWYSASALYAGALVRDVLPAMRRPSPCAGRRSAWARASARLAMLHAQRRAPGRVRRAVPAVGQLLRAALRRPRVGLPALRADRPRSSARCCSGRDAAAPVPVAMTCGAAEENIHNNRVMAQALAAQGYDAAARGAPTLHNYTAWRDAFDPHLTGLLRASCGERPPRELYSPAIGADGQRRRLRALGPAGARLPGRGRRRLGLRAPRHGRRASAT